MSFQDRVDELDSLVKSIESNAQRTGVVEKMGMCPIWAGIEDDTGKLAKIADKRPCPITADDARSLLEVATKIITLLGKEIAYWKPKVFTPETEWQLYTEGTKEEYRKTQLHLLALQESRKTGLRTWQRMRNNADQIVKQLGIQPKPSVSAGAQMEHPAVASASGGTNPLHTRRRGRSTSRTPSAGNKPSPSPHRPASTQSYGSTGFGDPAQTRFPSSPAKRSRHDRGRSSSPQKEAQDRDRMLRGYR